MTFWDHLEELRGCLIRIVIALAVSAVACFCFKNLLFDIVLAPKSSDFVTYRLVERVAGVRQDFNVDLINVDLAQQFLVHMKVALLVGFLIVSPYVLFVLFRFIAPGLYTNERRYAVGAALAGYVMFMLGVALNYFVIFPLTFRFLGTYQVDDSVVNHITLTSYISVLLLLSLVMGIVFELPVLSWLLAKIGVLKAATMSKVRRYAVVIVLIVSAIITPTGDPFTLMVVALPIYLLYEFSIFVVRKTEKI